MYNNSLLYQQLLKEYTKEEVDAIFCEELQKRNITSTDYEEFVKDYKKEYTEETIVKYVDLVSFFQLDIQNDFSWYILHRYILNQHFLDKICNFHCIQYAVEKLCKNQNKLFDKELLYISSYIDIIELNLVKNIYVTNKGLKNCVNLQKLNVADNKRITFCPISVIELDASNYNCSLDGRTYQHLKHTFETEQPFSSVSHQNEMFANDNMYNCGISDEGLKDCINLQKLIAINNKKIVTCQPFSTSLIELNASFFCGIDDDGLKNCHNLQILNARGNYTISTCKPFAKNLIKLDASYYCEVDDIGLKDCCNLQILDAFSNKKITTCAPFVDSLIELNASYECGIGDIELKKCKKLQKLISIDNSKITIKIENKDNL